MDTADILVNPIETKTQVESAPPLPCPAQSSLSATNWSGLLRLHSINLFKKFQAVLAAFWGAVCIVWFLAALAALPIIQFACLGYLLSAASNLANRKPWATGLPKLEEAGRLGGFIFIASLLWIPIWIINNISYSAQLLVPNTNESLNWRIGSFAITGFWLVYVVWAAMRGGGLKEFLWPAPVRFVRTFFLPETWSRCRETLYDFINRLQFPFYWWLGARATIGALLWLSVPALMMVFGIRGDADRLAGLVGLIGFVGMLVVVLYLPFLQMQFAMSNKVSDLWNIPEVRRRYLYAPWLHSLSLVGLSLLTIPLYLIRVEPVPIQLLWIPGLIYVLISLPLKLFFGLIMGLAERRRSELNKPIRHWVLRWTARCLALASCLLYVATLYIAQFVAGQGALIMFIQHAFLMPTPLMN